jgi:hypothetical protein
VKRPLISDRVGLAIGLTLLALGFIVAIIATIGEWRHWWRDVGFILNSVSLALSGAGTSATVWFGIRSATRSAVTGIGETLEALRADLAGHREILAAMLRVLEDRLPPRAS